MSVRVIDQRDVGPFRFRRWDDGNEQYMLSTMVGSDSDNRRALTLERVVSETSKRKRWVITDRSALAARGELLYPPKICGPFDSLEEGLAVYTTMLELEGWQVSDPKKGEK